MTDNKKSTAQNGRPAAPGSAFDLSEMFTMYDPQKIAQMFDPQKLFGQIPAMTGSDSNIKDLMKKNRASFDAMVEANKAAAETYKDMLEKQMEIFSRLTAEAQGMADSMESSTDADAAQ